MNGRTGPGGRTLRVLALVAASAAVAACEEADGAARLAVSDIIVQVARLGGGDTLSAGSRDSSWTLVDAERAGLRVSRRAAYGPAREVAGSVPSAGNVVQAMARGLRLFAEDPLPTAPDTLSRPVSWMLELPLGDAVIMRARIPASYSFAERRWVGAGEALRDFRWVAIQGERADTVLVHLNGTFEDRRAPDGIGEYSFSGVGDLILQVAGERYQLEVRQRTVVSAASESAIRRRQRQLSRELAPAKRD
ncbi:MAG: hypothetical protein HY704_11535 [Gemmatimonadetes bacterium]|nr:hypothetical protein [Gemmatimonadota bacterium]